MNISRIGLTLIVVISPLLAQAKLFSNSYVSFELPARWNCVSEGTVWTCKNEISQFEKEAVIILTAKEVGAGDSLAQYESYLKVPKSIPGASGQPVQSKIRQVKQIQINGQPWTDGLHLESEVPFYYTRYLATVKQRIAILVTFSAHQRVYSKYSHDFFRAIQSIRVIASSGLLTGSSGLGGGQMFGAPAGLPSDVASSDFPAEPQGSSNSKKNMIYLGVILLAVGAYIFIKSKKKKKKPKNPFT